jgi:5-methylcytosine-specific restriction endonuclease McrA
MSNPEELYSRPPDHEVFKRDNFRCVYCGFDGGSFDTWTFLQVDHFVPRSRGGPDSSENLKTSCIICNQMKGAKIWPSVEEAKAEIRQWREQMRAHWTEHVEPLIPKP